MDIHELSFYYIYILFFIYYVRKWGVCVCVCVITHSISFHQIWVKAIVLNNP